VIAAARTWCSFCGATQGLKVDFCPVSGLRYRSLRSVTSSREADSAFAVRLASARISESRVTKRRISPYMVMTLLDLIPSVHAGEQ
jgi:hypothetical protein